MCLIGIEHLLLMERRATAGLSHWLWQQHHLDGTHIATLTKDYKGRITVRLTSEET
jgi:hypothetical protein